MINEVIQLSNMIKNWLAPYSIASILGWIPTWILVQVNSVEVPIVDQNIKDWLEVSQLILSICGMLYILYTIKKTKKAEPKDLNL